MHEHIIGDEQENIRRQPCHGVGKADARKSPQIDEHERRDHPADDLGHAREHGDRALSDPLQRVAVDEDRAEEQITPALEEEELLAVREHVVVIQREIPSVFLVEEKPDERIVQPDTEGKPDRRADRRVYHAHEHALAHAVHAPRAVVLPRIHRHRRTQRGKRLRSDVIDLGGGGICRDHARHRRVEGVERRLLHDAPDRRDGELQRHGQPHRDMSARELPVPGEIRTVNAELRITLVHVDEAQQSRNELADDSRHRRAVIIHFEPDDEREIQPHIEAGGKNEEQQRRARIADRAQDPREDVIEHRRPHAAEDHQKIGVRVIVILYGRIHKAEQRTRKGHRRRGDDDGHDHAEQITHADRAAHARLVACAEPLGNAHGKSARQPVDEPEDEEGDRSRASHPRKGVRVDRVADDDGVRHVIKLLEHVPDEDGKRKP